VNYSTTVLSYDAANNKLLPLAEARTLLLDICS
jgi:hypothetical protein